MIKNIMGIQTSSGRFYLNLEIRYDLKLIKRNQADTDDKNSQMSEKISRLEIGMERINATLSSIQRDLAVFM